MLRALYSMRRLRGTRLDPFGSARVRRAERDLLRQYEELLGEVLDHLSPITHEVAIALAELPDVVRGYEGVKLASIARFQTSAAELRRSLAPATPV